MNEELIGHLLLLSGVIFSCVLLGIAATWHGIRYWIGFVNDEKVPRKEIAWVVLNYPLGISKGFDFDGQGMRRNGRLSGRDYVEETFAIALVIYPALGFIFGLLCLGAPLVLVGIVGSIVVSCGVRSLRRVQKTIKKHAELVDAHIKDDARHTT